MLGILDCRSKFTDAEKNLTDQCAKPLLRNLIVFLKSVPRLFYKNIDWG